MFVDEKVLSVLAGKGGDGAALFRREKYVPYGGPDGGDGGKGGDVIARAVHNLHALNHLRSVEKIQAKDGDKGGHQRKSGKSGEDEILLVPLGTQIWDAEGNTSIAELLHDGDEVVLAKGGNGGWGNWHFKSSRQQAPDRANAGQSGEVKRVRLVLKLIADIGLVGLPNAGKSTFLSSVTAAEPKIADYAFTTLEPQLGVVEIGKGRNMVTLVIADLPGLIEGASEGKGLGVTFLKHIERTKVILHLVDASIIDSKDIVENYIKVYKELRAWSTTLVEKQEFVALTKCELVPEGQLPNIIKSLEYCTEKKVYAISAATGMGVRELLLDISRIT